MAHEIEIVNGVASHFYVGETPWHGLGQHLVNPPTIKEGIIAAGLNWGVEKRPLFFQGFSPEQVTFGADMAWATKKMTNYVAVVRTDTNEELGVHKKSYGLVQNTEAFDFFEPMIENGFVTLETAGSLKGGARVWVLARIVDTTHDVVKGDPVNAYFLLSNSYDGVVALHLGFTGIRVVCQNTLSLAHHNDKSRLIKVKHTKNVKIALDKLRETIDWQRHTFTADVDQMRYLASVGCDEKTLTKYVELVFRPEMETQATAGNKKDRSEESYEKSVKRLTDKILPLFESGRGAGIPGVRGTMWGAYNAVTEYGTWERSRTPDARLESLWFGQNGKTNERAWTAALELAKAA